MFFPLCRTVRTTAKKTKQKRNKKIQSYCDKSKKNFFLPQLAAISQSGWPVPFSIGMQTTLLASTCQRQRWIMLEMDAFISTSLGLPEICRQINAKEPYWLHVVFHEQLNLPDMSIREQNGKKNILNHFILIAETNWTVSVDLLQRLREECMLS